MTSSNYRLGRSVVPVDYDIDVDASPRRSTFGGQVLITLRLLEPDKAVWPSGRYNVQPTVTVQVRVVHVETRDPQ